MRWLVDLLREPLVDCLNVDTPERLSLHASMLARKRMLREAFADFHDLFQRLDREHLTGNGLRLEIGAGVAPMKNSYPDVLATDVVWGLGLDRVIDAEAMNLGNGEVRVIFGQNCFHHFPCPERFFQEMERVLSVGGGAILIEPYHGHFAAFLFRRLFRTEGYDKGYPSWETPITGPMKGANQALSYIIFERDRDEFERRFPNLRIVHQETCGNYIKYLLSGGLNFRQLCPDWTTPMLSLFQWAISPLDRWLALHHVIVLRKEA